MICSLCGQAFKKKTKTKKSTICAGCIAYIAERDKYNQLLLKFFKNDPTLTSASVA